MQIMIQDGGPTQQACYQPLAAGRKLMFPLFDLTSGIGVVRFASWAAAFAYASAARRPS